MSFGCALLATILCHSIRAAPLHGTFDTVALAPGPLTTVSQVRKLATEQAAGHASVLLTGVVTCIPGYKNAFFLADPTGGISVEPVEGRVHLGEHVQVTGVTDAGLFAPVIRATRVQVLGTAAPPPFRRVSYSALIGGAQDSQPIEVEGIVHSAVVNKIFGSDNLILAVDMGGGVMRVMLPHFTPDDRTGLVDATVRVRGVCATNFNEKRQFVGVSMWAPLRADLEVLQPPPADAFSVPVTPIGDVMRFGSMRHRLKITGTVTYWVPGHALYLQQGSDAILVQTGSAQHFAVGQQVAAVGFPVAGEYSPVLSDGLLRVAGGGVPIQPVTVEAQRLITRRDGFTHTKYDQQLVQLRGTLVESHAQSEQMVSILLDNGTSFEAFLPLSGAQPSGELTQVLTPGSVLQLTGICSVHTDLDRYPTSFSVLLRSPADIVVLRRASWWNAAHLFMLLAASGAVVLATTLWVMLLRRQVRLQTSLLRASEEKFRYLATHDNLTQLLNRNAILEALDSSLTAARARGLYVGVAVIDLDHFKRINDTLGHQAGDEVLRQAAQRLTGSLRRADLVGRYGGEEFLVVMGAMNSPPGPDRCERIRLALCGEPVRFGEARIAISGSIGLASGHGDVRADTLIAHADQAMYTAKTSGRNRVVVFPAAGPLGASDRQWPEIEVESAHG